MRPLVVAAWAALLVTGGGDAAADASSRGVTREEARPPACSPAQLAIADGPQVSEATGQNTVSIVLTNRGPSSCTLRGYPTVALLDSRGAQLPFRISHRGDQMVTSRPPVDVRLRARRAAFFVLNKYRCDLGALEVARRLRVAFPGAPAAHLLVTIPRYPVIAYCGRGDPGSVVTISPFTRTLAAALAHG